MHLTSASHDRRAAQISIRLFSAGRRKALAWNDVLTGFLDERDGDSRGRPVGVAIDLQGGLLVADDVGNTIWRVSGPASVSSRKAGSLGMERGYLVQLPRYIRVGYGAFAR